jgi:hypothetical protein
MGITSLLNKFKSEWVILVCLGGLTGAAIFFIIYGPGTLDVSRVDWLFNLGDNAQHYLGWVFYRNDPWVFPIGFSQSLGYPGGTCMCFTDSIPLLAIPFKLLRDLLPGTFQYFGIWTLLCFILQGGLGALIIYEVTQNRLAAIIAPLFFCTADILLYRVFRYTPLSGQWIVLLALYLYFLNKRESRWNWLWPVVNVMAVLIQGYFFVMTFIIFCGSWLESYLKNRKVLPVVTQILINLVSTTLVMWVVGFFGDSVDMSNEGLGYFKANLNAFINPLAGWSRFFNPLPLAPDTYPNVNYLGIGVILLSLLGLLSMIVRRKQFVLKESFAQNIGLFFIIPVLVIFAISNVVTWNEHILFTYTLPEPLMRLWGIFRGTERMLWPVYYLILIFAIALTSRWSTRGWVTAVILMTGFGIQLLEVSPMLLHFHDTFSSPAGKKTTLRSEFWQDASARYKSLVILPLNLDNWARLSEFASDNRMNINYAYFARQSPALEKTADQKTNNLLHGKPGPDEMYVIKSPELLQELCSRYGESNFLAYVNKEWVLAPGFNKKPIDYPDISITAVNSNCSRLPLAEFLGKYRDKLLILSVMQDASTAVTDQDRKALSLFGLNLDLGQVSGMSYIGVAWGGRSIYEQTSPERISFSARQADTFDGLVLPVNLEISSAGRISGEEDAVIKVNDRDFAYHLNGLNIAVYDPQTNSIVDTAVYKLESNQ